MNAEQQRFLREHPPHPQSDPTPSSPSSPSDVSSSTTTTSTTTSGLLARLSDTLRVVWDADDAAGEAAATASAPWDGYEHADDLRDAILAISADRARVLAGPPPGSAFVFSLERSRKLAVGALRADPRLEHLRFALVPRSLDEITFWRNYMYCVHVVRQGFQMAAAEHSRERVLGAQATNASAHADAVESASAITGQATTAEEDVVDSLSAEGEEPADGAVDEGV
jgi:hypothetical protein